MSDGKEPVHGREWIAGLLERAEFVEWDRFVVGNYHTGEQYVDVYGWIDREDEYKDFVWTRFRPDYEPDPTMEFTTSSDEYSEELMRIWFGEDAVEDHNECRRVEHAFDVENVIELGEQSTLVTDGGVDEEPPELGEVMDFPDEPRTDDRRWIVLFEEDYDNVAIDPNGNVGVLVDIEQTGELFRLAGQTLASLSHRDAESDEPIRDLIEALEEVLDDE